MDNNFNILTHIDKLKGIVAQVTDPAQQKAAIETLTQLTQQLNQLQDENAELTALKENFEKSRRQYLELFDHAPAGFLIMNNQSEVIEANQATADLLSIRKFHLISKPLSLFVDPEYLDEFNQHLARVTRTGQQQSIELKIRRNTGDLSFVRIDSKGSGLDEEGLYIVQSVLEDITDKIYENQNLQLETQNAQQYFESAGSMLMVVDTEGIIQKINTAGCHMLGYSQTYLEGQVWFDLFKNPKEKQKRITEFKNLIENPQTTRNFSFFEASLLLPDGHSLYVRLSPPKLLFNNENEVQGVLVSGQDVTERQQVFELNQLQRNLAIALSDTNSIEQALAIITNTLIGFDQISCGAIYLYIPQSNTYTIALHKGLSQHFIDSQRILTPQHADTPRIKKGEIYHYTQSQIKVHQIQHLQEEKITSWVVVPISHQNRTIATLMLGSKTQGVRLLTQLKHTLEALAVQISGVIIRNQTASALKQSEERFRLLAENTQDLICLHAANGDFIYVSPSVTSILGYDPQELENKSPVPLVHPEEANEQLFKPTTETVTYRFRKKNGNYIWLQTYKKQIKDSDNQTRLVTNSRNITSQKQLENELKHAKQEAENASKAKSEFMANVSHELRTPLNGIMGMTELIEQTQMTPKQAEYMEVINASGQQLLRLIEDLLDFEKIEKESIELESDDFSLLDTIEQVIDGFKPIAARKGIFITYSIARSVWPVLKGDQSRLKQVLYNLIDNAVKFTESGFCKILVDYDRTTQSYEDIEKNKELKLRFVVEDTGIGIAPQRLKDIFERFEQIKDNQKDLKPGTGLGLSITNRLVQLLKGKIWVISTPGKGSRFFFTAAFERGDPDNLSQQQTIPTETTRLNKIEPLNILLAEDNKVNQKIAGLIFEQMGHQLSLACDGVEAVSMACNNTYDVIFMDIQMPGMDGVAATKQIIANIKKPVPIVAMTAFALKNDQNRFAEAGLDYFISKPISIGAIQKVLEKIFLKNKPEKQLLEIKQMAQNVKAGIDINDLANRLGGNKTAINALFNIFKVNEQKRIESMKKMLEEADYQNLNKEAHALKGASANISAQRLSQIASQLEQHLNQNKTEKEIADELMKGLVTEFENVVKAIPN